MKKIKGKILSLMLGASLIVTGIVPGRTVKAEEITLNKLDVIKNKIVNYVEERDTKDITSENIEDFLQNGISENEKLTGLEYSKIANESASKAKSLEAAGYTPDKIAEHQIIDTVVTKNNFKIEFLDNGLFSIENLNDSIKSPRASVWGQAYKDYYSAAGLRVFTVAVGSGFSYNGSKASYYGNFTAYYTRGTLSVWQVSNWKEGHEAVGTSYRAYASGNFHFGFEVNGVGIVIQDLYVRHQVNCDRNGNITKSFSS